MSLLSLLRLGLVGGVGLLVSCDPILPYSYERSARVSAFPEAARIKAAVLRNLPQISSCSDSAAWHLTEPDEVVQQGVVYRVDFSTMGRVQFSEMKDGSILYRQRIATRLPISPAEMTGWREVMMKIENDLESSEGVKPLSSQVKERVFSEIRPADS